MARRGENIRRRKDGRWEARYPDGIKPDGKKRYASVYGDTYREVKEKRLRILKNGNPSSRQKNDEPYFREIAQQWQDVNHIRLKDSTIYRYQYLIDTHILPELGDKPISQVNASYINVFLANKLRAGRMDGKGGLSPAYVRSIMLIIHGIVSFAAEEQLCAPLTTINKPTIPRKEIAILSTEHQKQLEVTLYHNTDATKIGVLLSLYAGLRIGEVCALSWDDIDLVHRTLHVRHTIMRVQCEDKGSRLMVGQPKTSSSLRCVPICSKLNEILNSFPPERQTGFVASSCESFVSPRTYEYRYRKLLKQSGVPHVNYHALRHTFATRCIEAGVDVKSLSEILGHSNVSITLNTYVHSSMELKRNQIEKLVAAETPAICGK